MKNFVCVFGWLGMFSIFSGVRVCIFPVFVCSYPYNHSSGVCLCANSFFQLIWHLSFIYQTPFPLFPPAPADVLESFLATRRWWSVPSDIQQCQGWSLSSFRHGNASMHVRCVFFALCCCYVDDYDTPAWLQHNVSYSSEKRTLWLCNLLTFLQFLLPQTLFSYFCTHTLQRSTMSPSPTRKQWRWPLTVTFSSTPWSPSHPGDEKVIVLIVVFGV